MTASSEWSVPRADRSGEVHETAPVAHQDKRFPRRPGAGNRRRRDQGKPGFPGDASAEADDAPEAHRAEADADDRNAGRTDSDGEDHVIDTLA